MRILCILLLLVILNIYIKLGFIETIVNYFVAEFVFSYLVAAYGARLFYCFLPQPGICVDLYRQLDNEGTAYIRYH